MNRFRWGLCVDVQPPDLETRIAILQLKAERERLTVPARRDRVRRRRSSTSRSASSRARSCGSSPGPSSRASRSTTSSPSGRSQDLIPQTRARDPAAADHGGDREVLLAVDGRPLSKSRSRPLTQARHIAMYLMRECTGLSLVKIGEIFGGRDHTTVLHGMKKVEDEMRARDATFRQVQDLTRTIRGRVRGGIGRSWTTAGIAAAIDAAAVSQAAGATALSTDRPTCRICRLRCGMARCARFPQALLPLFMLRNLLRYRGCRR